MKKSLSVLVAGAMVSSMFASIAFAADAPALTTQQKLDILIAAGIFDKDGTGNGSELDANMSREQLAKILIKLKGLKEVAGTSFSDVAADRWSAGFIQAATKATPPLMEGTWENIFAPADEVTIEQLAAVAVRALGLKVDNSATVTGTVSDWAKGYVAAAIAAGILPKETTDFTVDAKRSLLVESTYAASLVLPNPNPAQVSAKIVGASKIEVTFSAAVDDTKATFAVKKGAIATTINKTTFSTDKKVATIELGGKLTKGEYVLTVGGVVEKEYTQTFAVEDEKVTKIEFNSDKASFDRDSMKTIYAGIKLTNQYGEDVTKTAGQPEISVSKAVYTPVGYNAANGTITINSPTDFMLNETVAISVLHSSGAFASQTLTVSPAAKVNSIATTELYNRDKKTLLTSTVLTTDNFYLLIDAKDQYGKAITSPSAVAADTLVSVVGDIYVTTDTAGANKGFETVTLADGTQKLGLKLAAPAGGLRAGTSKVILYSTTSGKSAEFEVVVKEVAKVDSLSLSAPDIAVAGEKVKIPFTALDQFGAEVTSVSGLNGSAMMTALSVSNNTALPTVSGVNSKIAFEIDPVTSKPVLVLDLTSVTGGNAITSDQILSITGLTGTAKQSLLNVTVKANVKPVQVVGIASVAPNLSPGATTTLKKANLKVVDQYGRTLTGDKFAGYSFDLTLTGSSATIPSGSTGNLGTTADAVLTADSAATGVVSIKVQAKNESDSKLVAGSEYSFSVRTVSRGDIVDFTVADVAKLYTSDTGGAAPKYKKAVTVTGLLADGTTVTLPANDSALYSIQAPSQLGTVTNTVYAPAALSTTLAGLNVSEKTYQVTVTGKAKGGALKLFTKDVVVSNAAPVANSFVFRSITTAVTGNAPVLVTKEADGIVSILQANLTTKEDIANSAVQVLDQYGVELFANSGENETNVGSKFKSVDAFGFPGVKTTVSQLVKDESVTIFATTQNGKVVTFKLTVK